MPSPIPFLMHLDKKLGEFLNHNFLFVCSLIAAWLFTLSLWIGWRQPLWFDELNTLLLSRLPIHTLWTALADSADGNPPVFYLYVKALSALVPREELECRIPSILYFCLTVMSVYFLARPYMSRLFALFAALAPTMTEARKFIVEGRPYSSTLALTAVALLCWREAAAGRRRKLCLAGVALSIALAISSQYSATLVFAPLMAGEIIRTLTRRKGDVAMWIAIAAGAIPLLFLQPLLGGVRQYLPAYWARPSLRDVMMDTFYFFVAVQGPYAALFGLLVLFLALMVVLGRRLSTDNVTESTIGIAQLTAWIVLLCAPLLGYVQSLVSGGFTIRYALPMAIPYALVLALICYRLTRGSALTAAALISVTVLVASASLVKGNHPGIELAPLQKDVALYTGSPRRIVIGDPIMFMPLYHYANATLRSKLLYVPDLHLAAKYLGSNSADLNIERLGKYSQLPLVEYQTLVQTREPVFVFARSYTWIDKALQGDSVPMRKLNCPSSGCWYQAW